MRIPQTGFPQVFSLLMLLPLYADAELNEFEALLRLSVDYILDTFLLGKPTYIEVRSNCADGPPNIQSFSNQTVL
jgi:hypothetical protein